MKIRFKGNPSLIRILNLHSLCEIIFESIPNEMIPQIIFGIDYSEITIFYNGYNEKREYGVNCHLKESMSSFVTFMCSPNFPQTGQSVFF